MRQITFACQPSFEKHARPSRREQFLQTMETVVPWSELEALIEPHYPKAGNGRQPVGLSIMLRVYFLQQWFNLSDPGAEDALYESPALRSFAGVDLDRAAAPDETTILRFRRILEQHDLYPTDEDLSLHPSEQKSLAGDPESPGTPMPQDDQNADSSTSLRSGDGGAPKVF